MDGDLDALVDAANVLIGNLAVNDGLNHFKKELTKTNKDVELCLHKILESMLDHAEACSSESAKRYVAAAICACIIEGEPEDKSDDKCDNPSTLYMLRQLGKTWFTHFLFPFYFAHSVRPSQGRHGQMGAFLTDGAKMRNPAFRRDVLLRDGYHCTATEFVDRMHPKPPGDYHAVRLQACHILYLVMADFAEQDDDDLYKSATTTLHILRHYAALPDLTLKTLQQLMHDPTNGFLLETNARDGFGEFRWCLEETETPNIYKVRIYRFGHGIEGLKGRETFKFVEFEDHSSEFLPQDKDTNPSTSERQTEPKFSIPLPDPRWIRLHAALAGILNTSGAAKFLCGLHENYHDYDNDWATPIRCWEEFERLAAAEDFGRALQSTMIGITTH